MVVGVVEVLEIVEVLADEMVLWKLATMLMFRVAVRTGCFDVPDKHCVEELTAPLQELNAYCVPVPGTLVAHRYVTFVPYGTKKEELPEAPGQKLSSVPVGYT